MANEKRLIDPTGYKSFLVRYIKELHEVDAPMIAGAVERCLQKLEEQPTVDAVEVVHGQWKEPYQLYVVCSECGTGYVKYEFIERANYCPNCGAKMDGDGNGY